MPQKSLDRYLIERAFIQTILSQIIKELNKQFQSTIDKIKGFLGFDRTNEVQSKLEGLLHLVENNEHLKTIELPIITEVNRRLRSATESLSQRNQQNSIELKVSNTGINGSILEGEEDKQSRKMEKSGHAVTAFSQNKVVDFSH